MKYLQSIIFFFTTCICQAQVPVNRIGASIHPSFYTYGPGSLNNVVRFDEGLTFSYTKFNRQKKRGISFEFAGDDRIAYYKDVLPNGEAVGVSDFLLSVNVFTPIFYTFSDRSEHSLSIGVGLSALAERDFLNESDVILPYDNYHLREQKAFTKWTPRIMLDYSYNFLLSKKIGFTVGARYFTPMPINQKGTFQVSGGTGLSLKYGAFFCF